MSIFGIIAEFNPLHKGHEYLISKARENGPVVCVMSGNFVQRGETAIADKRIRALAALKSGADLVLELPVLWSMSTAQNFALGAVYILSCLGCDNLIFGSECGEVDKLIKTAEILESPEFSNTLSEKLKSGITFAKARSIAAESLGAEKDILLGANNNLAIEYIIASRKIGSDLEFKTVKRKGAQHDSLLEDEFVSASLLRKKLLEEDYEFCKKYMSEDALKLFESDKISDISKLDKAILAVLRSKKINELKKLPDVTEGLENKLFEAIKTATSLDELYDKMKVKRYTHARIRRLVLSAFLGFSNTYFLKTPPYIRVLGFNKIGEQILKENISRCPVPVVTKVSEINELSGAAKEVFSIECGATDLFALSLNKPLEMGLEYKSKLIKL